MRKAPAGTRTERPRPAKAGVACTLQVWAGQVHAFPVLAGLLPEVLAALGGGRGAARRPAR